MEIGDWWGSIYLKCGKRWRLDVGYADAQRQIYHLPFLICHSSLAKLHDGVLRVMPECGLEIQKRQMKGRNWTSPMKNGK